jgi:hypothetical protein
MTCLPRSMKVLFSLALGASMAAGACNQPPDSGSKDVGVVTIELTATPPDANCLTLQYLQTTQQFPTVPGMRTVITLEGLPQGCYDFNAKTFVSSCDQVTPTSVPTWLGGASPCITPGFPANAQITMRPNSTSITIGLDFTPACGLPGTTCTSGDICCAGACSFFPGTLFGGCGSSDQVCTPGSVMPLVDRDGNTRWRLGPSPQVLDGNGNACTADCSVAYSCGYGGLGKSLLFTCALAPLGNLISPGSCPRPPTFMGATTAGMCEAPDGSGFPLASQFDGQPCSQQWSECFAFRDPPLHGFVGCVCMADAAGTLTTTCQQTNGWFELVQ